MDLGRIRKSGIRGSHLIGIEHCPTKLEAGDEFGVKQDPPVSQYDGMHMGKDISCKFPEPLEMKCQFALGFFGRETGLVEQLLRVAQRRHAIELSELG